MAVRNIARGGGKAFKVEVTGLKELERKVKALLPENPAMRKDLYGVVGGGAEELRDEMRSAARAAGWGSFKTHSRNGAAVTGDDAIASIFADARERSGSRTRISALAGVSKKKTM